MLIYNEIILPASFKEKLRKMFIINAIIKFLIYGQKYK